MARAVYADFQAKVGLCKKGEDSEKSYSSGGTATVNLHRGRVLCCGPQTRDQSHSEGSSLWETGADLERT